MDRSSFPMGVVMPEETGLDTAIPPTSWQDTSRESQTLLRRQRGSKKKKQPAAEQPKPSKKLPEDGTGTNIDFVV